jgi:hypothetical protein
MGRGVEESSAKRKRVEDDDDKLGGPARTEGLSIGEQTSNIKNKQKRGELLGKLKHKKKVRRARVRVRSWRRRRSVRHNAVTG